MPKPRALTDPDVDRPRASSYASGSQGLIQERLAGVPRKPGVRRWWPVIPVLAIALLLLVRSLLHTPPLDVLARGAADAADPPGTTVYTGSIAVTRGGPVFIGFQSQTPARLTFAGRELRGAGIIKERIVVPQGATAIRFAAPAGARLVWNQVGRRGDLEYVSASSLSPEPPDRASFDAPGTARLDGAIALAILVTVLATIAFGLRRRLAAVSRDTWLAMGAVFVVGVVLRVVGGPGQTWDEDVNWASGRNYVTNLLSLDFTARSWVWNYEHPPVMKYLVGIGAQLSDGMGPARVISAITIAIGCALLVPIGARLYRPRVGVLAALLAAMLPPFIAHGQVVGHEAPTVLWWSLGILLSLGVHDYLPARYELAMRTLRLRLLGVGVIVGIAIASRFINGLLGPLCALIVVVQAPPRWRNATIMWGAILMPIAAAATVYFAWPRLWGGPVAALSESFNLLDKRHAVEPFLGAITDHPGQHYFVVYLFATLPAGVLLGVLAWFPRAIRDRDRKTLILAAWFLVPLAISVSPVRQDGVRYVMPCIAALAMMAAAGFDQLASLLERRLRYAFLGIAAFIAGYMTTVVWRTHPYHLDYFGEHTGGVRAVAERGWFETAWWGEGLEPSLAYVDEHAAPNALVDRLCVEPTHLAWFREDLWNPARGQREAAWIVVYAPLRRPCPITPDARKVFEVIHDGLPMSVVYQRP